MGAKNYALLAVAKCTQISLMTWVARGALVAKLAA